MTPRKILPALIAGAAAASLIAGCGGGESKPSSQPKNAAAPADPSGDSVTISSFRFQPATLTVKSGATITVTNNDSTTHTATADDGNAFDTGDIDPGSSATFSVDESGTVAYHCNIHPFMKATIVVE